MADDRETLLTTIRANPDDDAPRLAYADWLELIFNTCFLVVRDQAGNVAWGTHSINTRNAFGAGIMVDGVYAAHAMNREHVLGTGASTPGISTGVALFKDGKPRLIAGSPGFGFVHGPWQYATGIIEWGLSPTEAMNQPRFGLPNHDGKIYFESHYDARIFELLKKQEIQFVSGRPSQRLSMRNIGCYPETYSPAKVGTPVNRQSGEANETTWFTRCRCTGFADLLTTIHPSTCSTTCGISTSPEHLRLTR